jgi:hypothetical protein
MIRHFATVRAHGLFPLEAACGTLSCRPERIPNMAACAAPAVSSEGWKWHLGQRMRRPSGLRIGEPRGSARGVPMVQCAEMIRASECYDRATGHNPKIGLFPYRPPSSQNSKDWGESRLETCIGLLAASDSLGLCCRADFPDIIERSLHSRLVKNRAWHRSPRAAVSDES